MMPMGQNRTIRNSYMGNPESLMFHTRQAHTEKDDYGLGYSYYQLLPTVPEVKRISIPTSSVVTQTVANYRSLDHLMFPQCSVPISVKSSKVNGLLTQPSVQHRGNGPMHGPGPKRVEITPQITSKVSRSGFHQPIYIPASPPQNHLEKAKMPQTAAYVMPSSAITPSKDIRQLAADRLCKLVRSASQQNLSQVTTKVAAIIPEEEIMTVAAPSPQEQSKNSSLGDSSSPSKFHQRRVLCIGDRCDHVEFWKRLRAKKGTAYYICRLCAAKWRITSTLVESVEALAHLLGTTVTDVSRDKLFSSYSRREPLGLRNLSEIFDEEMDTLSSEHGSTPLVSISGASSALQATASQPIDTEALTGLPSQLPRSDLLNTIGGVKALLTQFEELYPSRAEDSDNSEEGLNSLTPQSEIFPFSLEDLISRS